MEEEKLVEEKEVREEEEVEELASSFLAMGACTLSKAFLGLSGPEGLPQACSAHFSDPGT